MAAKNKGLGRGLDAILQSPETDITSRDISGDYVAGAVAEIDINLIEANPFQPRTEFDEVALAELAQSIKEQGIIQPVTVPRQPSNSRAKTLIVWTFFGIVLGCGIVLGKSYLPKVKEMFAKTDTD